MTTLIVTGPVNDFVIVSVSLVRPVVNVNSLESRFSIRVPLVDGDEDLVAGGQVVAECDRRAGARRQRARLVERGVGRLLVAVLVDEVVDHLAAVLDDRLAAGVQERRGRVVVDGVAQLVDHDLAAQPALLLAAQVVDRLTGDVEHQVAGLVQHRVAERVQHGLAGEEVEHGLAAGVGELLAGERVEHRLAAEVGLAGRAEVVARQRGARRLQHRDAAGELIDGHPVGVHQHGQVADARARRVDVQDVGAAARDDLVVDAREVAERDLVDREQRRLAGVGRDAASRGVDVEQRVAVGPVGDVLRDADRLDLDVVDLEGDVAAALAREGDRVRAGAGEKLERQRRSSPSRGGAARARPEDAVERGSRTCWRRFRRPR